MYETDIKLSKMVTKRNFKVTEELEQEGFLDDRYVLQGQNKYTSALWDDRQKYIKVVEQPIPVTDEMLVNMDVI